MKQLRRYLWIIGITLISYGIIDIGLGGGFIRISGMSMFPTFVNGDRALLFYSKKEISRFDLVEIPSQYGTLLKRIVGLPNEHLIFYKDYILINGKEIREPFIYNNPTYMPLDIQLAPDEYFVLGDNRDISFDSRSFGGVDRKHISKVFGYYIRF